MKKRDFFDKLHTDLANKYGLTPGHVGRIRSMAIEEGLSLNEIGLYHLVRYEKIKSEQRRTFRKCKNPQAHYPQVIAFLQKCTPEQWEDITQITKFDKQKALATN